MTEQELDALRREFETFDAAIYEIHRLRSVMEIHSNAMHPWYGPCDGLGENGQCSECDALMSALRRRRCS
jgi:hypothetical protein